MFDYAYYGTLDVCCYPSLPLVNESTYTPDSKTKMGDHPVIWTNEHCRAKNIYIFMGHHPDLFDNPAFATIVRNSTFWAAQR